MGSPSNGKGLLERLHRYLAGSCASLSEALGLGVVSKIRHYDKLWRTGKIAEWEYFLELGKVLLFQSYARTKMRGELYLVTGMQLAEAAGKPELVPSYAMLLAVAPGQRNPQFLLTHLLRAHEIIEQTADPRYPDPLQTNICSQITRIFVEEKNASEARVWASKSERIIIAAIERSVERLTHTEPESLADVHFGIANCLCHLGHIANAYTSLSQFGDVARVRQFVVNLDYHIAWERQIEEFVRPLIVELAGRQSDY